EAGRVRDHRREPGLPRPGEAPSGGLQPGDGLARHGDARGASPGGQLHPGDRASPGPEGRLPRGDRLPDGLHRRRPGPGPGRAAPERIRPVPSGPPGAANPPMNVIETRLPGVMVIEPRIFRDDRGYFLETWSAAHYGAKGLPTVFAQDNLSCSSVG